MPRQLPSNPKPPGRGIGIGNRVSEPVLAKTAGPLEDAVTNLTGGAPDICMEGPWALKQKAFWVLAGVAQWIEH